MGDQTLQEKCVTICLSLKNWLIIILHKKVDSTFLLVLNSQSELVLILELWVKIGQKGSFARRKVNPLTLTAYPGFLTVTLYL